VNISQRSAVLKFSISALGVCIAFAMFYLPSIPAHLVFVPWHPDDFLGLRPFRTLLVYRPVAINSMHFLAGFGFEAYFSSLAAILIANIVFSIRFLEKLNFGSTPNLVFTVWVSITTAATWFFCVSSVLTFQYLGMIPAALSYLFGIVAANLICCDMNRIGPTRMVAFAVFVLLSAFAKEDMAAFLLLVALWSGWARRLAGSPTPSWRTGIVLPGIVIAGYGASFAYSSWIGSVIFSGEAEAYSYDGVLQNILDNFLAYALFSPATILIVCVAGAVGCAGIWLTIKGKILGYKTLLMLGLSGALLAPYLVLPRVFGYYLANVFPFLIAGLSMFSYAFFSQQRTRFAVVSVVVFSCVLMVGTQRLDANRKNWALNFFGQMREQSYRVDKELKRLSEEGLSNCETIYVTGVDDASGPFRNTSSSIVDSVLGRHFRWIINAPDDSRLGSFAVRFKPDKPRWRYQLQPLIDWNQVADCHLKFDPESLKAVLTKRLN